MGTEYARLADVSQLITKGTTPTTLGFNFTDQGIGFLRVQNIEEGQVIFGQDVLYIDEKTHNVLKRSQIKPGDVLVSIAGSIGRSAVVPEHAPELNCNQAVAIIRIKDGVFQPYLRYWLESSDAQSQMRGATVTGTISNLSLTQLGNLKLPLPPIAQQRRIAAILDKADELRSLRRRALEQLDAIAQSTFLEMFGDPVTNPKGWITEGIESVCELIVDCVNRTAPIVDGITPYKMIRTSNVKGGKVLLSDVRYVDADTFKRWNRRTTPKRGDLLLTREAPVGEAGILDSDDQVFLGQRLMLYRTAKDRMTPEYLLYSFLSRYMQNQFSKEGSGSTVKHLPLPVCRSLQVRVPSLSLQEKFTKRIQAIEQLKTTHREAIAQLDALFASLQHRAFRGEL